MPVQRSVLIVEDSDEVLRPLVEILVERRDIESVQREMAGSALAQLGIEMPDLILSDLQMPGMSGFELLSIVRQRFSSIPVIAMSGTFSCNSVPPGVAADAFYPKGTPLAGLIRLVDSHDRPCGPGREHRL